MILSGVTISFATQAIPSLGIPKGFRFTGDLKFLGITTIIGFQLIPGPPSVSATITADFPGSEVAKVRSRVAVGPIFPSLVSPA